MGDPASNGQRGGARIARKKSFDLIFDQRRTPGREDIELPRKSRRLCRHARVIISSRPKARPPSAITSIAMRRFKAIFSKPSHRIAGYHQRIGGLDPRF